MAPRNDMFASWVNKKGVLAGARLKRWRGDHRDHRLPKRRQNHYTRWMELHPQPSFFPHQQPEYDLLLEDILAWNSTHTQHEGGISGTHPAWPIGQDHFDKTLEFKGEDYVAALDYIYQKAGDEGILLMRLLEQAETRCWMDPWFLFSRMVGQLVNQNLLGSLALSSVTLFLEIYSWRQASH
ncbi:hypothetical protein MMC07_008623 [Pseudocyphellaria aurata]|nr:hypothetical protein [Pseudocyphellaria aurata]